MQKQNRKEASGCFALWNLVVFFPIGVWQSKPEDNGAHQRNYKVNFMQHNQPLSSGILLINFVIDSWKLNVFVNIVKVKPTVQARICKKFNDDCKGFWGTKVFMFPCEKAWNWIELRLLSVILKLNTSLQTFNFIDFGNDLGFCGVIDIRDLRGRGLLIN